MGPGNRNDNQTSHALFYSSNSLRDHYQHQNQEGEGYPFIILAWCSTSISVKCRLAKRSFSASSLWLLCVSFRNILTDYISLNVITVAWFSFLQFTKCGYRQIYAKIILRHQTCCCSIYPIQNKWISLFDIELVLAELVNCEYFTKLRSMACNECQK